MELVGVCDGVTEIVDVVESVLDFVGDFVAVPVFVLVGETVELWVLVLVFDWVGVLETDPEFELDSVDVADGENTHCIDNVKVPVLNPSTITRYAPAGRATVIRLVPAEHPVESSLKPNVVAKFAPPKMANFVSKFAWLQVDIKTVVTPVKVNRNGTSGPSIPWRSNAFGAPKLLEETDWPQVIWASGEWVGEMDADADGVDEKLGELLGLAIEAQESDKEKEPVAPSKPSTTRMKFPALRLV